MADVVIYTRPFCGYCARAISLLDQKGVAFTEIEAGMDPGKRSEMIAALGGRTTFPQIFIGGDARRRLRRDDGAGARRQARPAAERLT